MTDNHDPGDEDPKAWIRHTTWVDVVWSLCQSIREGDLDSTCDLGNHYYDMLKDHYINEPTE